MGTFVCVDVRNGGMECSWVYVDLGIILLPLYLLQSGYDIEAAAIRVHGTALCNVSVNQLCKSIEPLTILCVTSSRSNRSVKSPQFKIDRNVSWP
jgi:hypothetical protein